MNIAINNFLRGYLPVSLMETEGAALLNRVDVKYLLPLQQLPALLADMQQAYKVLEIDGARAMDYTTWYYDSADFRLYLDHHNGYVNRIKVRQRRYETTGDCFFEIKRKINETRTEKKRVKIPALHYSLSVAEQQMIQYPHLRGQPAAFKLCNRFNRITLCDADAAERVTIDTGISMEVEGKSQSLESIALIEVKQRHTSRASPCIARLRQMHVVSTTFSKYAVGAALLYAGLKHNNFKPVLNNILKYGSK